MKINELTVGALVRRKNHYTGEAFHVITRTISNEFIIVDISGKYGFNTNGCCSGEMISNNSAEFFEIVSTWKIIQLTILGLFVNLTKKKERTGC